MHTKSATARPTDILRLCLACDRSFVWSVGEQAFFAGLHFDPPKRCRPCRLEAKQARRPAIYLGSGDL